MDMFGMLQQQLTPQMVQRIAGQIGADPETTAKAIQVAVPAMMTGVAKQASDPAAAPGLFNALTRDHDGSILESADGLATHSQAAKGAGILSHLLGGKQQAVAQGVSQASGLDPQKVLPLLITLAPLIMGALGRARAQGGVHDAGGLGGLLASVLGGMGGAAAPGLPGGPGAAPAPSRAGGLGGILDSDNDGQVADDIAKLGASVLAGRGVGGLLGGLMGGRR